MILTDREIQIALDKGQISIDPAPTLECYSSTTLDLRLAEVLTIFNNDINDDALENVVDPAHKSYKAERLIARVSSDLVIPEDGYVLVPNKFILGRTLEKVHLPEHARLAARVEGKSSLARLGLLVHFTAPTIHSGFDNTIRLEIMNLGPLPIRLRKGIRICQLVFELTFGTPDKAFVQVQTS